MLTKFKEIYYIYLPDTDEWVVTNMKDPKKGIKATYSDIRLDQAIEAFRATREEMRKLSKK